MQRILTAVVIVLGLVVIESMALEPCPSGYYETFSTNWDTVDAGEIPSDVSSGGKALILSDNGIKYMGNYQNGDDIVFNVDTSAPHDRLLVTVDYVTSGRVITSERLRMRTDDNSFWMEGGSNPEHRFEQQLYLPGREQGDCLTEPDETYRERIYADGTSYAGTYASRESGMNGDPGYRTVWSGESATGCAYCGDSCNWKTSVTNYPGTPVPHNHTTTRIDFSAGEFDTTDMKFGLVGLRVCLRPVHHATAGPGGDYYNVTEIAQSFDESTGNYDALLDGYNDPGYAINLLGTDNLDSNADSIGIFLPWSFPYFCDTVDRMFVNSENMLCFRNARIRSGGDTWNFPPMCLSWFWSDVEAPNHGGSQVYWYYKAEADRVHVWGRELEYVGSIGNGDDFDVGYTIHQDGTIDIHVLKTEGNFYQIPGQGALRGNFDEIQVISSSNPGNGFNNKSFRYTRNYECEIIPTGLEPVVDPTDNDDNDDSDGSGTANDGPDTSGGDDAGSEFPLALIGGGGLIALIVVGVAVSRRSSSAPLDPESAGAKMLAARKGSSSPSKTAKETRKGSSSPTKRPLVKQPSGKKLVDGRGSPKKASASPEKKRRPTADGPKQRRPTADRANRAGSAAGPGSRRRPSQNRTGGAGPGARRPSKGRPNAAAGGARPAPPAEAPPPMPQHDRPVTESLNDPEVRSVLDELAQAEAEKRRLEERLNNPVDDEFSDDE